MGRYCGVFDLHGHPTALRCYAWSHAVEGSEKRRYVAVLHRCRWTHLGRLSERP